MHFLHLDSPASLVPVPPFGILEPLPEYSDGSPREDALESEAPLQAVSLAGGGQLMCAAHLLWQARCLVGVALRCRVGEWRGARRKVGLPCL
jgi:hypothetical protein